MRTLLIILGAWGLLSVPVALVFGRFMRINSRGTLATVKVDFSVDDNTVIRGGRQ